MDKVTFVTSFSEKGRLLYGNKLLDTWSKLSDFDLFVFLENTELADVKPYHNVAYMYLPQSLLRMHDHAHYSITTNLGIAEKIYGDYRFQASKFARKILAVSDPDIQNISDWLIWIDGDTVLKRVLNRQAVDEILDGADWCCVAYLGRKNWHHSECGFVAYSMNYGGKHMLHVMRNFYNSMMHYKLPEWHDSYVFDHIRQKMEDEGYNTLDLSKGLDLGDVAANGNEALHIWPHTVLGKYFDHNKGALKNT